MTAYKDILVNVSAPQVNISITNDIVTNFTSKTYEFSWESIGTPNDGEVHPNHALTVTSEVLSSEESFDIRRVGLKNAMKVEAVCSYQYTQKGDTMLVRPVEEGATEFVISTHHEWDDKLQLIIVASWPNTDVSLYR